MSKSKSSTKDTRTRSWSFILYPESAPQTWRDIITDYHVDWVESPLHDRDLNADGQPKKAHYHILLMFDSVKSYEQVLELIQPLNVPIPERVHSASALVRYMAHLDNPDKAQYLKSDIIGHGVDVSELLKPRASERYTIIGDIMTYCRDARITEMKHLLEYAYTYERDTWWPLLCDNSCFVINCYVRSQRHFLLDVERS